MALSLDKSIQSVLAQSFTDWELLIVDNCSTDHPDEIVKRYSDDKRIRLLSIDEKDRSKARNHGIANSNGDYITFLDADDTLHEDYLKTYAAIFENAQNVITFSDLILIKDDEKISWSKSKYSGLHKLEYCLNYGNMAFAAPTELFDKFKFEGQTGEDRHLLARASEFYVLHFTRRPYYNYFDHVKIETREQFLEGKDMNLQSLKDIYNNLEENYSFNYPYQKALFEMFIKSFYVAMSLKYKKEAGEILKELPHPFSVRSFVMYIKAGLYFILK